MTYSSIIRSTAVGLVAAAVLAGSAFAGGEPKNQWPFTRSVERTTQVATKRAQADAATRALELRSEAMNRRYHLGGYAPQGEAKNEIPFTEPPTVVVRSSAGFDWTSGGIGVISGIGLALAGAAGTALARKSPRSA